MSTVPETRPDTDFLCSFHPYIGDYSFCLAKLLKIYIDIINITYYNYIKSSRLIIDFKLYNLQVVITRTITKPDGTVEKITETRNNVNNNVTNKVSSSSGRLTFFPQCNFSWGFPEILSQNLICYH